MVSKRKASSGSKSASSSSGNKFKKKQKQQQVQSSSKKRKVVNVVPASDDSDFVEEPVLIQEEEEEDFVEDVEDADLSELPGQRKTKRRVADKEELDTLTRFIGEPVEHEEAVLRWPHRYQKKEKKQLNQTAGSKASNGDDDSDEPIYAIRHYIQAEVDGQIYNLDDDAFVQAEDDKQHYICKIREFFQGEDELPYFTAQWFYRAEDTVIKNCSELIDVKRVFFSEIRNDNPLDCLVKKLTINRLPQNMNPKLKEQKKLDCDYYYDMMYFLPYCSFVSLPPENAEIGNESDSTISSDNDAPEAVEDVILSPRDKSLGMTLLDLYSGCGAMSTGLCLGANSGGVKLTTKWAVDFNRYACASLSLNHPETLARHESAGDFLSLLKEWESLCVAFSLCKSSVPPHPFLNHLIKEEEEVAGDEDGDDVIVDNSEIFEVEEILDIKYGDPNENNQIGLYFKIRWKGYGAEEDTWEPLEGLSGCPKKVKDFVTRGFEKMILPLPGNVDVICGGPPCQGISGYNRFRNSKAPLEDEKNKQLLVYMDIVRYLKPKFVLMENVVDILRFSGGYLGRYAFGSLVGMNYQARLGLMAAGAYGLPQFRMRIFLWGALAQEKLPRYPLPTHNVVVRGMAPKEFEGNVVAYEEVANVKLKKELILGDAISDLPEVQNDEGRDEMPYVEDPKSDFQRFIRQKRGEMPGSLATGMVPQPHLLYDHRPLNLNNDDYLRVCQIPKRKGANFRDLPGVRVGADNKVEWDPAIPRVLLPSGKPLVPDYAMSFVRGTSSKPFGRLWYDQTVPTVMTRAEPHNHVLLHPFQDRVLTVRENARLQGFPDYYKLVGPIKERYIQVGNAVAVPVACALGYSLAQTCHGLAGNEPLFALTQDYPLFTTQGSAEPSPGV